MAVFRFLHICEKSRNFLSYDKGGLAESISIQDGYDHEHSKSNESKLEVFLSLATELNGA